MKNAHRGVWVGDDAPLAQDGWQDVAAEVDSARVLLPQHVKQHLLVKKVPIEFEFSWTNICSNRVRVARVP